MARTIKLSGRESGVLRAIGFGLGATGTELSERTQMPEDDLVDVLNGLLDSGFVEAASMRENVSTKDFAEDTFEVNPSYTSDLKLALQR